MEAGVEDIVRDQKVIRKQDRNRDLDREIRPIDVIADTSTLNVITIKVIIVKERTVQERDEAMRLDHLKVLVIEVKIIKEKILEEIGLKIILQI